MYKVRKCRAMFPERQCLERHRTRHPCCSSVGERVSVVFHPPVLTDKIEELGETLRTHFNIEEFSPAALPAQVHSRPRGSEGTQSLSCCVLQVYNRSVARI